ncbi:MAG: hypothetical protein LBB11_00480 [Puniceicoccales bacterium]|nr:hypothetical protein [Puniceicoccales bacterium]
MNKKIEEAYQAEAEKYDPSNFEKNKRNQGYLCQTKEEAEERLKAINRAHTQWKQFMKNTFHRA